MVESLVGKLKEMDLSTYANRCFKKTRPEDVEPIFDTFLLEHMNEIKEKNQLGLSGVLLDERTAELKQMKANRPQNYYDFWNENIQKSAQPDAPFKHTDQFTYEYEPKRRIGNS